MAARRSRRMTLFAASLLAASLSCKSSVDPDRGRFSCPGGKGCGEGFECRPQASGEAGRCYRVGECQEAETCDGRDDDCNGLIDESFPEQGGACDTGRPGICAAGALACTAGALACAQIASPSAESCDGRDDDCDGLIDESFPEQGAACDTGRPGVCAAGARACATGALSCAQIASPSAESCNGLDDNCEGAVDEGFDLTSNPLHCGRCGLACPAGTACLGAQCHESVCSNGLDDDGDALADCADQDCVSLACSLIEPQLNCGHRYPSDAGDPDGGGADGGGPDAGVTDAGEDGSEDGGEDGGEDAGEDGGGLDAGVTDAGEDGGGLDAGGVDAGEEDAGFDAGEDGGPSDGGSGDGGNGEPPLPGCVPREADCANGSDDDLDGLTDCADDDCEAKQCRAGAVCAYRACP